MFSQDPCAFQIGVIGPGCVVKWCCVVLDWIVVGFPLNISMYKPPPLCMLTIYNKYNSMKGGGGGGGVFVFAFVWGDKCLRSYPGVPVMTTTTSLRWDYMVYRSSVPCRPICLIIAINLAAIESSHFCHKSKIAKSFPLGPWQSDACSECLPCSEGPFI